MRPTRLVRQGGRETDRQEKTKEGVIGSSGDLKRGQSAGGAEVERLAARVLITRLLAAFRHNGSVTKMTLLGGCLQEANSAGRV